MMDEFPTAEEEYEMLHQDEMDVLRDMDFDEPHRSVHTPKSISVSHQNSENELEDFHIITDSENDTSLVIDEGESTKRNASMGSDLDSDLDLQPPSKKSKMEIMPQEPQDFRLHCGVTSLRVPKWPFITFNTWDSDRYYVKFNENQDDEDEALVTFSSTARQSNLLGVPYEKVKQLAERTLRLCEERDNLSHMDNEVNVIEEDSQLWVEKYKPKKYLELLSDEGVNRSLLNWIKKWDRVVFNKTSQKISKHDVKLEMGKKALNRSGTPIPNPENDMDEDGRPHYKIALLCGPPGLGKTTLAHVIARLAGYNVIEVNASDDRSIEAFQTKLDAATQMQCVMGSNKPNCLVLDEIDGAPAASVEYLLKYIMGKGNQKEKGKKEKGNLVVRRPVICICNEPYIPSLRQLRQQSYVVHFPHTSSSRLAQRLLEICRKQNIKTDLSTLTILCDKMQSDIRCCISTLHFFKSRNGVMFKASDVSNCNIGQKDLQKGLFSLWQEIFQIPMKKKLFSNDSSSGNKTNNNNSTNCMAHFHYSPKNMERLRYLVQLFSSSGDLERLQQGVHENFLLMKFPRSMEAISEGVDWFCWFDRLDNSIKQNQNYILMQYLPFAFASWHFLFSSVGFNKITYPKTGYENHVIQVRMNQILSDVLRGLTPRIRAHTHGLQLTLDILPMFKTILVPTLRPVSLKLFNDREKKDFGHLLDIMIDYNLNYMQRRSPDGTYHFDIDPNIDELTQFSLNDRNKLAFSYNMKQFISRELEMERVRRNEGSLRDGEQTEKAEEVKKDINSAKRSLPNHLQSLTPKEIKIDTDDGAQYKDFFGRVVTAKSSTVDKGAQRDDTFKSKMWFTYKEGFNNAVKKDITISYFL